MPLKLNLKDLDKVLSEVKQYPADMDKIINNEFKNFGQLTVNEAQTRAPKDEGFLTRSINYKAENLSVAIGANVDYAAYLEFGTKGFAASYVSTLPPDWQQFAAQYKGSGGGTFQQLVARITQWIHRKGLGTGFAGKIGVAGTFSVKTRKRTGSKSLQETQDKQAAYLIARKIITKGIPAQPFLFPAFEHQKIKLIENLKSQLNAK